MTHLQRPSDSELHAYLDGELAPDRQQTIAQWLAAHPDDAARIAAWQGQRALLQHTFAPVEAEPLPERLRKAAQHPRRAARPLLRVAAALAWMSVGGLLGFTLQPAIVEPPASIPQLAQHAALAHAVYTPEVRHPVEVGADQEAHLVKWLSKRLGTSIRIPSLVEKGYHLVGGRLLPGETGPVAQFMYEEGSGRRLTLYLRHGASENRDTAFHFSREGVVGVFYWIDGELGYALSGELPRERLLGLAESAYNQLSL